MIRDNVRTTEQYDIAVLFAAMVKIDLSNRDGVALVQIGYDEALLRCRIAAAVIARDHWAQGDCWDGVWWFEVLQEGPLAEQLFLMPEPENDAARIAAITTLVHELLTVQQGMFRKSTSALPTY